MVKYTVKIYPQAIRELDDIYQYIASDKQSPGNGKAQLDRIKGALIVQTKCAFVCIWFCWILMLIKNLGMIYIKGGFGWEMLFQSF